MYYILSLTCGVVIFFGGWQLADAISNIRKLPRSATNKRLSYRNQALRGAGLIVLAIVLLLVSDEQITEWGNPEILIYSLVTVIIVTMLVGAFWEARIQNKINDLTKYDQRIANDEAASLRHEISIQPRLRKLGKKKRKAMIMVTSLLWLGIPMLGLVVLPHLFNLPMWECLVATGIGSAIIFAWIAIESS